MRILTLIFSLVILLIGCSNPYKKIISDPNLTGENRDLMAQYCYIHFKPEESYKPGQADSSGYKKKIEDLSNEYNKLVEDYEAVVNNADSNYTETEKLKTILASFKTRIDSLNGIITALKKGIPCPKIVDTIYRNDPKEIAVLSITIKNLKTDILKYQIDYEELKLKNTILEQNNKQLTKDKNKGWYYFWGLIIGIVVLLGVYIYLKIRNIIKF